MRRRDFVTFLGGATAWVGTSRGEEPQQVLGWLSAFSTPGPPGTLAAFYQGLKETGFVEGKNLTIEFRWAGGHYDRLPSLAAELVARNVAVIVASDAPSSFAAKAATGTIPIVFASGADPVVLSLVDSFNQPRGTYLGDHSPKLAGAQAVGTPSRTPPRFQQSRVASEPEQSELSD